MKKIYGEKMNTKDCRIATDNEVERWHIETVIRAIRLCQMAHDLRLSEAYKMLTPIFGEDLVGKAKVEISNSINQ